MFGRFGKEINIFPIKNLNPGSSNPWPGHFTTVKITVKIITKISFGILRTF